MNEHLAGLMDKLHRRGVGHDATRPKRLDRLATSSPRPRSCMPHSSARPARTALEQRHFIQLLGFCGCMTPSAPPAVGSPTSRSTAIPVPRPLPTGPAPDSQTTSSWAPGRCPDPAPICQSPRGRDLPRAERLAKSGD